MERQTLSLNGNWSFWTDPSATFTQNTLSGEPLSIQVPAPWQSQHDSLREYTGTGWYKRTFHLPQDWLNDQQNIILHVGAADYAAEVWWNGQPIGAHEGGYLPFSCDATAAARSGENTLVIRVSDPPEIFAEVPHGKQSWYGMLSGLWQPLWVELRPRRHLLRAAVRTVGPDVTIEAASSAPLAQGETLRVEILDPQGKVCAQAQGSGPTVTANVVEPRLWDIGQPNLYTARLTWMDPEGMAVDSITERFGFRTIAAQDGQILLNGRPLYVRAALDQDYYPETIATPPSMEFLRSQFQQALDMGLNMLRIHIKVGDPRYYQAADEVGLLLWTELPNFILLTEQSKARARETLAGMVERDGNHPSIVIWTVINESWGVDLTNPEHRAWLAETYHWMKELDPSRLVVGNSACHGNAQVVTDIADFHVYYAMPDHAQQFAEWVETYASRPDWLFCPQYPGAEAWAAFLKDPWRTGRGFSPAPENQERGDEPLLVSEFGNWGLPDVAKLIEGYGGKEPWWFETGYEFGEVVYPHGVEQRYRDLHLNRAFSDFSAFSRAHQRLQFDGMKREIELMRRHASIQGYVITEFTDVHWECNGLLDMHRNPKVYYSDMAWLNADDLIVPELERSAFWAGEEAWVRLYFSHYAPIDLKNCTLEWSLEGFADVRGQQPGLQFEPYTVSPLGGLHLEIPAVTKPVRATLHLRMLDGGEVAARNKVGLVIFPYQRRLLDGTPIAVPEGFPALEANLRALGCRIVPAESAALTVTPVLTDTLRERILAGGKVLLLAESAGALATHLPGLRIVDRPNSPWQGDWASSVGWVYRDRLFHDLPAEGLVDFAFEGLTPEAVVPSLHPRLFHDQVHAGMAVGWLHRPAATIAEQRFGRGKLLVCTFRLQEAVQGNPLAAYMMAEMVRGLASE